MQNLTLTIIQADLAWAYPEKNIAHFDSQISAIREKTDLIILPEMFSTGFNMSPKNCSELMDGFSIKWMKEKAAMYDVVICGSLLIKEGNSFVNRFIWMRPDGTLEYYDKKHLFSLAGENKVFTPGNTRVVVELKGFKILLQVCYDLRFPVFSRNTYNNGFYNYDAVIYTANWPAARRHVWRTLLMARAMENQAYVIGVNRIGKDFNGTPHSGDSAVVSPKGEIIIEAPADTSAVLSAILEKESLDSYRKTFLNAADWDKFKIL